MLRVYRHRVNSLSGLEQVPTGQGIEFDLRSDGDRVIVTHDPFTDGPTIDEFFPRIGARPCIFNVKCEGIESRVLAIAAECGIEDFFFLDLSVTAAVNLDRAGETRIAVRYYEHQPLEGIMAWAGRARWVWVDCFTRYPGEATHWRRIADAFRVCVASPELYGHEDGEIPRLRATLAARRYDAVCSKRPDQWEA